MPAVSETVKALFESVAGKAREADVFESVSVGDRLECLARDSAEPAWYRVEHDAGTLWIGLYIKDRWLSESIESELLHTGDKMEELLDEEMVDLGFDGGPLPIEHFRSDDMEFTFRSSVDASTDAESVAQILLGYEACFRQLGDMSEPDDG